MTVQVVNETDSNLSFTPYWNGSRGWRIVHSGIAKGVAIPRFRYWRYELKPGQGVLIHVISDKAHVDALAIKTPDGRKVFYQLFDYDGPIKDRWYHESDVHQLPRTARIVTLDSCPPWPEEVTKELTKSTTKRYLLSLAFYAVLTSPVFFVWCYRIRRRSTQSEKHS